MRLIPLRALALAVSLMALALTGCGTTKVMESWQSPTLTGEKPEKVAVLAVWPDELQRVVIERDMVKVLRDKGANAVESSELPGMRGKLNQETAEIALRNAGVDSLVVVFIVGGGGGQSYERSDYWLQYEGSAPASYGWYYPYYAGFYDVYSVQQGPGYAEKTTEMFLETSCINVRELERSWSFVTKSEDVEYQDVALKLAAHIVDHMKKAGQI